MNTTFGFYIKHLRVIGSNVKPAEIIFDKGFNVVSGLSDTGKSYIFACINYMLGGGDIPKSIPESRGYSNIYLEIGTYEGVNYTLHRKISGGDFIIKEVSIDEFLTRGESQILYHKHSSTNQDNISTFLLGLSGFDDKYVKKNKQNKKRQLSFRDIVKLSLIDEARIITEDSPVYSGQVIHRTPEQYVFEIMLTQNNAKDLVTVEEEIIYKGRLRGKVELVESYISEITEKLISIQNISKTDSATTLSDKLSQLNKVLTDSTEQLNKLNEEKRVLFNEVTALESKMIQQDELLDRFLLLTEHYRSDIKRLEFITYGDQYFSQLTDVHCPLCGGDLDKNHYDCIIEDDKKSSNVIESIQFELSKIKTKLEDLESTIEQLTIQKKERQELIDKKKSDLTSVENKIQKELQPVQASTQEKVNELMSILSAINEQSILNNQLKKHHEQKDELQKELEKKKDTSQSDSGLKYTTLYEFCGYVKNVLENWKYPNLATVVFDSSYNIFDIVINDKFRNAHGKGFRAITYSAFIIALLDYCRAKNYPHSGNIIIDSPLTTYQGRETTAERDQISKDMEDSFFSNLSTISADKQIIIFDNKDPKSDVKSKINYIHFTGIKNRGRQGFFPL
ncbi:hypothetical protein [Ascidiimonas sp. W6]|uniref:hypothetical protein n=1 Tax=Ascidiimonas meishanensis TaxID=3128903 RepID=UPI0030EE4386